MEIGNGSNMIKANLLWLSTWELGWALSLSERWMMLMLKEIQTVEGIIICDIMVT